MKKKKAVAYVRVSTKSDAQTHSYEYQNEYWQNIIRQNAELEFCGIYADKGISGKAVARRPQFLQMLEDARNNMIDIIYTKSVARFGRNTEELLTIVRELREKGIKVFFEKEQIDTFDPSAEVYLSIAAAVAENDLKIYSENQRWAIRERFANGFISIGTRILGYRMNAETNTLEIEPAEAEIIRLIFKLYLSGIGFVKVADRLTEMKIKNGTGEVKWCRSSIRYILTNEKYKGCSLQQKTVTYLGDCKLNKGEAKQYYIENTHEPIIDAETFKKVQQEIYKRAKPSLIGKQQSTYTFSGLVKCGNCKAGYAHKIQNSKKPWAVEVWVCQIANIKGQKACDNTRIKDSVLKEKFVECYNEFVENNYECGEIDVLRARLRELLQEEQELTALKANRLIILSDYKQVIIGLKAEVAEIKKEIERYSIRSLSKKDFKQIKEFSEDKVEKFIERVTINKGIVTFLFVNKVEISRPYNNGPSGNQKGWVQKKQLKENLGG